MTEGDWKNADQGLGKPASSLGRNNLTLITLPWTIRQVISAKTLYDKNLRKIVKLIEQNPTQDKPEGQMDCLEWIFLAHVW